MPDEREKDSKLLIGVLVRIQHELSITVHHRTHLLKAEYRSLFPGPWLDVRARIQESIGLLERKDFDWHYVEGVGMTGAMLALKKGAFDMAADALEAYEQEVARVPRRRDGVRPRLRRFLKMANLFLGSLGKAIPLLEVVKEYKDTFEAGMGYPEK